MIALRSLFRQLQVLRNLEDYADHMDNMFHQLYCGNARKRNYVLAPRSFKDMANF